MHSYFNFILFTSDFDFFAVIFFVSQSKLIIKVTFARNLAKKLSPLFYYLILLFQLSVANPENFEEFKAQEVLKTRKEKTGVSPTSLASLA